VLILLAIQADLAEIQPSGALVNSPMAKPTAPRGVWLLGMIGCPDAIQPLNFLHFWQYKDALRKY